MDEIKCNPKLIEGSVTIWIADLPTWRNHISDLRALLSLEELDRLSRLKIEEKQVEFICSRGLLRLILSHYRGQDPRKITIGTMPSGKPFHQGSLIEFSVSHSSGIFGFGFSSSAPLGIDIQEMYKISSPDRIIDNFFHPAEIDHLRSIPDHHMYREHFFAIWTAKEAYLKAIGEGIQGSFRQICILPESESLQRFKLEHAEIHNHQNGWTITALNITEGYRAALAIDKDKPKITKVGITPENFPLNFDGYSS